MKPVDGLVSTIEKLIDEKIAKALRGTTKTVPAEVAGTDDEGTTWVSLPGAESPTPVRRSSVEVSQGDIVSVTVGDGIAVIDSNISNPSAGLERVVVVQETANKAASRAISAKRKADSANKSAAIATGIAKSAQYEAAISLKAESAVIVDLQADAAKIHSLTADQLNATVGYIGELTSDKITAADISADHAHIGELEADTAKIHDLTADQLSAATAYIEELGAGEVYAQDLMAAKAVVGNLKTIYADMDVARIDTAILKDAWVDSLMVQTGLIAHEEDVFTLDAIQVNAASIKAGTLDVERLIMTVNDEKYLVHIDPEDPTQTPVYEKLDGGVIEDLTVTADKIVAGAITTEKITTENVGGPSAWINFHEGKFKFVNATSGEGIEWDGEHLHVAGDVVVSYGSIADAPTSIAEFADAGNYVTSSQLSDEVNTINGDIDTLGTDLSNLGAAVDNKIDESEKALNSAISGVDGKVDTLSGQVSSNISRISNAEEGLNTAKSNISKLQESADAHAAQLANISSFTTIEAGKVTLGLAGSPIQTLLTGEGLSFQAIGQTSPIAYLGVDENGVGKLFVTNAVVVQDLELGDWAWTARKNKHLTLKYIGS